MLFGRRKWRQQAVKCRRRTAVTAVRGRPVHGQPRPHHRVARGRVQSPVGRSPALGVAHAADAVAVASRRGRGGGGPRSTNAVAAGCPSRTPVQRFKFTPAVGRPPDFVITSRSSVAAYRSIGHTRIIRRVTNKVMY